MDLTPLLAPRSIAVVGANDRPDSYAGNVLRNLERAGFEGPVWGVNPKREQVLGRACVPSVGELPEAVDAVVVAIPAPGVPAAIRDSVERGCGGAVVLSAGFGEVEAGPRARGRAARGGAAPATSRSAARTATGSSRSRPGPAMWGDSIQALEPGPVAMISQSGNVAVNALGSRRGIRWHTIVSTGNQAVCEASDWLGAICELDGVRSIAMFLESDGDGVKLAEALARCCRARDRGRGAEGRRVGTPGPGPPPRTPARWPGTTASSGRWSRRPAPHGRATRTSCSSSPARWPSPGRARAATVASPCSPARAGTPGSPPTSPPVRNRASGARPGHPRRARRAAAGRGDGGQPARLHGADLG